MARSLFYRRRFLNRRGHHAGAYVLAEIEVDRGGPKAPAGVYADLTIADCGRVTSLDFSVHRDADAANALHKARLLKEVLDGFVTTLERAIDERARIEVGR